jgi:putative transposase
MTVEFKRSHFERDVILWGVRWYVAYPISYRQIEEMMGERGVEVDHSTLNRWVLNYMPALEKAFLARKRPVGRSWRLDETYVRVKGAWKYSVSFSNRHHPDFAGETRPSYYADLG